MTPAQTAVGELLIGGMEAIFCQHRSDFACLDIQEDVDTHKLTVEGITSDYGARFFFEVGQAGTVGRWHVRPVRTVQMGYLFQAITKALEVLRNAE